MSDAKQLLTKWRTLNTIDLQAELEELTKKQFKLKMQHAIGELKTTHSLRDIKRNIARIIHLLETKK